MKQNLLSIIVWVIMGFQSIALGKTIEQPDYEMNDKSFGISIDRIELTDSAAFFDFSLYGSPGSKIQLDSAIYIKGKISSSKYKIKKNNDLFSRNYTLIPETGYIVEQLVFEPISSEDISVDFIEPNGRKIYGIKLQDYYGSKIKTHISGKVEIPTTSFLILEETGSDFRINKSYIVPVRDGKFNFDLYTYYPLLYTVMRGDEALNGSMRLGWFWTEGKDIDINIVLDEQSETRIDIEGGNLTTERLKFSHDRQKLIDEFYKKNEAYCKYHQMEEDGTLFTSEALELFKLKESVTTQKEKEELNDKIIELESNNKLYSPDGLTIRDEYYDFLDSSIDSIQRLELQFYKQNLNEPSLNGLAEIYTHLKYNTEIVDNLLLLYENNYTGYLPEHPYSKYISEIMQEKSPIPGNKFIDIVTPNLNGEEVKISDVINGKIAVIDLWASWCGPCRKNSMALIPVYEKYKDKGFEIIGIARENGNTEAMSQAIEKDGYPWVNLVDLNDKKGVWTKYRVGLSGGKQILVDKTGIIIAIDPSAEEVERYLDSKL